MLRDSDLRELLDRARIADTIYAYCDHVDRADVDAVVELFAEDGVVDLGGGAFHRGHAELRDMFTDRFALYSTTSFHSSGVRIVHYDGATATTTTSLYAFHEAAELKRQLHLWGRFEDELVNESGTWRCAVRHLRVAGISHTPSHEVPKRFSQIERNFLTPPKA